jgi:putative spermidine/putrescine transport system ATP-binding protein
MRNGENFSTIRLDRVSRRFGSHVALDELSLDIARGEFLSLLGPSGCGKSTALNCLAGLLPLSGGSILIDHRRIDHLPPERRGFGMVFQNYALFPHMTVRENVGFGLKMRGVARAEIRRRVDEALALVQLVAHADKLPSQLSGGQQQRVAIARAIVIEPPLILMDEPLSNLDAKLRLEMRTEIRRIHRKLGRATVYVTHDQDEALSLSDRIVVLKDGVVQQIGAPQELYLRPATLDVASFMGYRNVLPLTVTGVMDGKLALRDADGGGGSVAWRAAMPPGGFSPAPGADVLAAVRPDDFRRGGEGAPNLVTGRVETVEYAGRDYVVTLTVPGGMELHVRIGEPVAPGETVQLSVPEDRVLVYPGSASAMAALAEEGVAA